MASGIRLTTAGESHGRALVAILEGVPAGLALSPEHVDPMLARRQKGYGRGGRMRIESDCVDILTGMRGGVTLGSPLSLVIHNNDATLERLPPVTRPRPGHADLAGMLKMNTKDARDILERTSARSTAVLVAAGAVTARFLGEFGITVDGFCRSIGGVEAKSIPDERSALLESRDGSDFFCPDAAVADAMREAVDVAKADGDTLGGLVEVRADGVPPGLGHFRSPDEKIDGRLAVALMGIPAMKAVEIGDGFRVAGVRGSEAHDAILPSAGGGVPQRGTNRAGGVEGGMTNGQRVVVRAAMKPLSSLRESLPSVDAETGAADVGARQRSDVCAVPAASVVAEAAVALVLAEALLEKTGGDTMDEVRRNLEAYRAAADGLFPPAE
ncbi:MAG: chorismate synthase [Planctomycetota bacterium]|jgi:chorismate synthase